MNISGHAASIVSALFGRQTPLVSENGEPIQLAEGDMVEAEVTEAKPDGQLTLKLPNGRHLLADVLADRVFVPGQRVTLAVTEVRGGVPMVEIAGEGQSSAETYLKAMGAPRNEGTMALAREALIQQAPFTPKQFAALAKTVASFEGLEPEQAVFMTRHNIPINRETVARYQAVTQPQAQLGALLQKLSGLLPPNPSPRPALAGEPAVPRPAPPAPQTAQTQLPQQTQQPQQQQPQQIQQQQTQQIQQPASPVQHTVPAEPDAPSLRPPPSQPAPPTAQTQLPQQTQQPQQPQQIQQPAAPVQHTAPAEPDAPTLRPPPPVGDSAPAVPVRESAAPPPTPSQPMPQTVQTAQTAQTQQPQPTQQIQQPQPASPPVGDNAPAAPVREGAPPPTLSQPVPSQPAPQTAPTAPTVPTVPMVQTVQTPQTPQAPQTVQTPQTAQMQQPQDVPLRPEQPAPAIRDILDTLFLKISPGRGRELPRELDIPKQTREIGRILTSVLERAASLPEQTRTELLNTARDIVQTLRFTEQISHCASFAQMPVTVNGERTTAQLYVFNDSTEKKKIDPRNATLFLSLSTAHLGTVEGFVKVIGTGVEADFSLQTEKAAGLFRAGLPDLNELLEARGYRLERVNAAVAREGAVPPPPAAVEKGRAARAGRYRFNRTI
ncbi:MAG: flagellar hook-length control protein FliK [Oscillospiraceae bacterium]|nr:flagellar hook-length control protein FliK [Oscillospiraceae bacterium]